MNEGIFATYVHILKIFEQVEMYLKCTWYGQIMVIKRRCKSASCSILKVQKSIHRRQHFASSLLSIFFFKTLKKRTARL